LIPAIRAVFSLPQLHHSPPEYVSSRRPRAEPGRKPMTFDEAARARLHEKLAEFLGSEEAAIIMERLHPEDWSQLATKSDLEALRVTLETKFEGLETKFEGLETKFEGLETKFEGLETKVGAVELKIFGLDHEVSSLRAEVVHLGEKMDYRFQSADHKMHTQFAEMRTEMHQALKEQFARTMALLIPSMFSAVGLAFAAAKFS
jgi:chromosome segregation ATPase